MDKPRKKTYDKKNVKYYTGTNKNNVEKVNEESCTIFCKASFSDVGNTLAKLLSPVT